jgi:hypothetical protein
LFLLTFSFIGIQNLEYPWNFFSICSVYICLCNWPDMNCTWEQRSESQTNSNTSADCKSEGR